MASGRTIWMGMDVAFMRRERNITLALEAGPDAWGVLLNWWLEAKEQRSPDGTVKFGYVSIGQRLGMTPGRVREIVAKAVEIGVLTHFREEDRVCKAVVTDFAEDDRRGGEALKKARQRRGQTGTRVDNETGTDGDNDPDSRGQGDELSPDVPNCPPRVEKSRVDNPPSPPEGAEVVTPSAADRLPDDLPPELHRSAHEVFAALSQTHAACCPRAAPPTLGQTGRALAAFPAVDHLAVADELAHWAIRPSRPIRDLAATYRTFVKRRANDPAHVEARPEDAWERRERRWQKECTAKGVCWNCGERRPEGRSNYCSTCLAGQEAA